MRASQLACVAGLVVAVVAIDLAGQHPSHATTRPAPVAQSVDWQQRLDNARTELEANTTALHAASLTGQPVGRLTRQWCTAVADYNTVAAHLAGVDQISTKDCK